MRRNAPKPTPMRTVGVKVPEALWTELNQAVERTNKDNPGRRYTVSDLIRERLFAKDRNGRKPTL